MKHYPKIEYYNKGLINSPVIAFDKLDGSNLRFEWSRKRGFYKYGTRKVMIDTKDEQFGKAIPLFLDKECSEETKEDIREQCVVEVSHNKISIVSEDIEGVRTKEQTCKTTYKEQTNKTECPHHRYSKPYFATP